MDIIKFIRCNREVSELLEEICDVSILPILKEPQNQNGQLKYNIAGMTFAKEKSGSEYILLEDDSIGYWGSEGKVGRIADNLTDFFELIVNCPYWIDYLDCSQYSSKERLRRFANIIYEEHVEMFEEDMDPVSYVEEKGLKTVNDEGALRKTVEEVIANNPQSVEDYHNGKEKAIGFLVGQTMKAMKGKCDPGMVNQLLKELL